MTVFVFRHNFVTLYFYFYKIIIFIITLYLDIITFVNSHITVSSWNVKEQSRIKERLGDREEVVSGTNVESTINSKNIKHQCFGKNND